MLIQVCFEGNTFCLCFEGNTSCLIFLILPFVGNWEGDFRLWESLCSKALVFVDYIYAPFPHPLIDGEDVVFFDPLDKEAFVKKVLYYLENKEEARKIAMNGFYKAVKYHRYINRVDYMLNTVNLITDPAYKVS